MNTLEFNKKCARFLNVEIVQRNEEDAVFMFENAAFPEYFKCTKWNTFHEDWNLLMKISRDILDLKSSNHRHHHLCVKLEFALKSAKKDRVINTIDKFLDWYNYNLYKSSESLGKEKGNFTTFILKFKI